MNTTKAAYSDFNQNSEVEILKEIYKLNQNNVPEVGDIPSFEKFINLVSKSKKSVYIRIKNKIIGFIVCFRENSDYDSLNYKFFSKRTEKFMYIDRVAIDRNFRNKGLGNKLYNQIEMLPESKNIPLCCEVNFIPLNHPSICFHEKYGFIKVGKKNYENNSVFFYEKK